MRRIYKIGGLIGLMGLYYLLIFNVLNAIDDSPRWGSVQYPEVVYFEKEFPLTVNYFNVHPERQMFAYLGTRDSAGAYVKQINWTGDLPRVYGTGSYTFWFKIDSTLPIAHVTARIGLYEILDSDEQSQRRPALVDKNLATDNIQIINHNIQYNPLKKSLKDVMTQSIETGYWKFGLNDPSFQGWLITIMYFIAAVLYLWYAHKNINLDSVGLYRFWIATGILLILLGLNKQFDLQTLLTDVGRSLARENAWYTKRHVFQIQFISIIGAVILTGITIITYNLRSFLQIIWPTLFGLCVLTGFILLRASSHHIIDKILRREILFLQIRDIFEIAGLIIIIVAGFYADRARKTDQRNMPTVV